LVFFFQDEDVIRDFLVTGVQACALPIFPCAHPRHRLRRRGGAAAGAAAARTGRLMAAAPDRYDAIVIGAGAAGLMCALTAGQRGERKSVVEHANKPGKKILMSGGGRCNFTNTNTSPANYLSANPHFCKSALARYTPWQFIEMVD